MIIDEEYINYQDINIDFLYKKIKKDNEILINITGIKKKYLIYYLNRFIKEQEQWINVPIGIMLLSIIVGLPISIIGRIIFPRIRHIGKLKYVYNIKIDYKIISNYTVKIYAA